MPGVEATMASTGKSNSRPNYPLWIIALSLLIIAACLVIDSIERQRRAGDGALPPVAAISDAQPAAMPDHHAVKMATSQGDVNLQSQAMLAQAEVALRSKNAELAAGLAQQAQQRFASSTQLESEWRAWLIAAQASRQLGDQTKAAEQVSQAKSVWTKLEQQWGSEAFKAYLNRPDIQIYLKELG